MERDVSEQLPLQLRVHRGISEIPREAWDALVNEAALPFLAWDWLEALESTGCATPAKGWHPRHLALWEGNRLVAAAPAYVKDHSFGEFVYDWSWASAAERLGIAYYPKLVFAVPFSPATGPRVLLSPDGDPTFRFGTLMRGAIELAQSEGLSSVHVLFPTEAEASALESLGFGIRHGVQYHWLNEGYGGMEDFLGRFNSKRRNQLRRERRAPAAQGISLRTLRGEALASVDPAEVHRIYRSTVDKHPWGRPYLSKAFFTRVLTQMRDRVEWVEARRDGRLLAGAFNLASPNVLYGRYWGCFEEIPFLHFNVCFYHSIEQAIERRLVRFEPGAGGEHKLVRGFSPSLTYSAHWIFESALDRPVRTFCAHERTAIAQQMPRLREEAGLQHAMPGGA